MCLNMMTVLKDIVLMEFIDVVITEVPSLMGIYFDIDEDVFYVTSNSTANNQ